MTWALVILLAAAVFVLIAFVLKVPRGTREAVAAALLLGIAGYVTQGSPSLPGAPKEGADAIASQQAALLVDARQKITDAGIPPTNHWVIIADGLSRNGKSAEAAQVLLGAVEKDPKEAEAWLAMANALVAHADGTLTPAALYAYKRAAAADPKAPGPPFFLGLAYAQGGQYDEARKLWYDLFRRTKDSAPWKPVLAMELIRLETAIQGKAPAGAPVDEAPAAPPSAVPSAGSAAPR